MRLKGWKRAQKVFAQEAGDGGVYKQPDFDIEPVRDGDRGQIFTREWQDMAATGRFNRGIVSEIPGAGEEG